MYQLLYISDAAGEVTDGSLRSLVDQAQQRNSACGITGVLMYSRGRFLQVLEGPESEVRAVFRSIQEDDRHTNVRVLVEGDVESRRFDAWSMGLVDLEKTLDFHSVKLLEQVGELFDAETRSPDEIVPLMLKLFSEEYVVKGTPALGLNVSGPSD